MTMTCLDLEETSTGVNSAVLLEHFLSQYGPLMASEQVAKVLQYPSPAAFDRSRRRGKVTLPLRRIPNRRGTYALVTDVVSYLLALEPARADSKPKGPQRRGKEAATR